MLDQMVCHDEDDDLIYKMNALIQIISNGQPKKHMIDLQTNLAIT